MSSRSETTVAPDAPAVMHPSIAEPQESGDTEEGSHQKRGWLAGRHGGYGCEKQQNRRGAAGLVRRCVAAGC